jgi:hypothetical protein
MPEDWKYGPQNDNGVLYTIFHQATCIDPSFVFPVDMYFCLSHLVSDNHERTQRVRLSASNFGALPVKEGMIQVTRGEGWSE